jgi:hypothetical protein
MLSQGELLVDKDLTIQAKKNAPVTVNAGGNSRVFEVASTAHVTFANLTITGGNQAVNVPNAFYGEGGGILNSGMVTINNSTLRDNTAYLKGGGIFNLDTLLITNSVLTGNTAGGYGGGIFNFTGTVTIDGSALSNNRSDFEGGGIFIDGGTVKQGREQLADGVSVLRVLRGILSERGPFTAAMALGKLLRQFLYRVAIRAGVRHFIESPLVVGR